jgi:oxygen-independent coproporphyrinogen-3 oxidase
MDFIFGLPGQTYNDLVKDVNRAFENGANCIAMYPFINFSFSKTKTKPMNEKDQKKLVNEITNYLAENGDQRGSIWTFAKPNTQKYSSMTRENYLGFGCSVVTLLEKQFKTNTFSIESYLERIDKNSLATSLTRRFSVRQRMSYYLFWEAYTMTIDSKAFENFFSISLYKVFGFEMTSCRILGMVKQENGR